MSKTLFMLFACLAILAPACAGSQEETASEAVEIDIPKGRKSPIVITKDKVDDKYVKVVYGQPYKKGRDIFGALVPFDQVWRTGANEATEITTTAPLQFGELTLEPGTYTLFTIPKAENWTIVVNAALGQWGAFDYNESKNVGTFEVPVQVAEQSIEAFTIKFITENEDGQALDQKVLRIEWDTTFVDIPYSFK